MKESIGGISLFTIVIFFIILFTGYMSLSINYAKAYNVKNEIVNIIKNQGGVCTEGKVGNTECENFSKQITDYFHEAAYYVNGKCDGDWKGFDRKGNLNDDHPAFCVKAINLNVNTELPKAVIYQVKVFYQLDLPIFSGLFRFSITGETSRIYSPNECKQDPGNFPWCS